MNLEVYIRMAELQLKIVKNTDKGVFGKAINNFNKVLYSSGGGFFNIVMNGKRNSLLKAYANFEDFKKLENENKQKSVNEKYEKVYDNYLNSLERYITETIYNRVKKKVSNIKENQLLSEYYEINALKGTEYCEYRYRIQLMLLHMDWETIIASKSDIFINKFKKFYTNVVNQLYKSIMRHYAIQITNTVDDKDKVFNKIYNLAEEYIQNFLPYLEQSEENKLIEEAYKNYVQKIDSFARKDFNDIKRELHLLELAKKIFVYSLPTVAAEECYMAILEKARIIIENTYISADKFETYTLLLDTIESYNFNVLSQKVVWDNDDEKEKYQEFWNQFLEYKKLERIDFDEYKRLREVLFITREIKELKKSKKDYKGLFSYYRERMRQQKGLRGFKNSYKIIDGKWRTRRRIVAD